MKYYKIQYRSGDFVYAKGESALEIIKRFDLCTRENAGNRLIELSGEQAGIAKDFLIAKAE